MIQRSNFSILAAACLMLSGTITPAHGQLISEQQRLNFGEWVVTRNDGNYSVTVNTDGSYNHSPELIELAPPQEGFYQVEGLPSFANILSVTVIMTQPLSGPGSQNFTMDNFTTIAPNADINGDTSITLGARAVTSGSTVGYGDGVFQGELTLEINL